MDDNDKIKLIGAVAAGAIGGLLLGSYIWGTEHTIPPFQIMYPRLATS